ncbi:MAG: pyridoxamine 5'-phosphate oxidase [Chloroflexi bacterium]|nr:pyridoxamine 5'-phosphate oxidase [Chloroflexota bacterium]
MLTSDLRKTYSFDGLNESDLAPNPFTQFGKWFQQAVAANLTEPNAMTLATATKDGLPSARMVLLKGFDESGFVFFTNYESQKGRELAENPNAALVFYWAELERQVRMAGPVSKVSLEESVSYFKSRPEGSRLGAWASRQSQVISDREMLEERLKALTVEYQDHEIPLPPFWGGYRLSPRTIEFWQGRPDRLHDRLRYTRHSDNRWLIERLSP